MRGAMSDFSFEIREAATGVISLLTNPTHDDEEKGTIQDTNANSASGCQSPGQNLNENETTADSSDTSKNKGCSFFCIGDADDKGSDLERADQNLNSDENNEELRTNVGNRSSYASTINGFHFCGIGDTDDTITRSGRTETTGNNWNQETDMDNNKNIEESQTNVGDRSS